MATAAPLPPAHAFDHANPSSRLASTTARATSFLRCDYDDDAASTPNATSICPQPAAGRRAPSVPMDATSTPTSASLLDLLPPSLSTAIMNAAPAVPPPRPRHVSPPVTSEMAATSDMVTSSLSPFPPSSPSSHHRRSTRRVVADADAIAAWQRHVQRIDHFSFNVGSRYKILDVIGEGAYGIVCSALHRPTGQKVAIKKMQPFEHQMFALRTLRELKLLRYFQDCEVNENIISILDIIKPPSFDLFNEVYIIQELMETDLHRVIRTQKLSDDHAQYFTYQVLRALKAMHSADIIHRDLKPSNLLLNANCDLKVCDFGLARSIRTAEPAENSKTGFMTEYVATRWYRAPEIMLTFKQYTKAIDIWAVGTILAEMISGRPLFPGRDYHHQLSLILDVLGTPSLDDFYAIGSKRSRDYIRAQPLRKRKPFAHLFPRASPECLDFLQRTLAFNPRNRPTVEECLAHPYLAAYADPDDEPSCAPIEASYFSYDLEKATVTKEQLREELWQEVHDFQPLI